MAKDYEAESNQVLIDLYQQATSAGEQYRDIIKQFSDFLDNRLDLRQAVLTDIDTEGNHVPSDNEDISVEKLEEFSVCRESAFASLKSCTDQLIQIDKEDKLNHAIESSLNHEFLDASENFKTVMRQAQILDRQLMQKLHTELGTVKNELSRIRGVNRTKNAYNQSLFLDPRFIDKIK